MIKRVLAVGMVQLVLCLALATGAETQSNKAVEFIKLSSEAENYFLNEDYERVKTAVEKMDSILERQIKLAQRSESFSLLSTPKNGREKMLVQKGSTRCENHCSNWSFRYYDQLCSFWATDLKDAFVEVYSFVCSVHGYCLPLSQSQTISSKALSTLSMIFLNSGQLLKKSVLSLLA